MFKKIASVLVMLIIIFALAGCNEEPKSDSEILYEIKALLIIETTDITENIIIPTVDNEDVTISWTSSKPEYLDIDGTVTRPEYTKRDQTISLTAVLELNDALVTKIFNLKVLSFEQPDFIELTTEYTDALVIDFAYDDFNFIADAKGEVDLVKCIDGDTTVFSEGGAEFIVRFLGIDTPESTFRFDPWGKAASEFTCEKLENAETIVLEWDPAANTRTDGNDRYLAYVWYDGRLLNLELIEEAYTKSKGASGLKYQTDLYYAEFATSDTDRRVWGEDDPNYDYSLVGVQITIEELVTNPEMYIEKTIVIRGIVSRKIGDHPYIQDGDFGVYLYSGFTETYKLDEGNEVLISGLSATYHEGQLQLTSFVRENAEVMSEGNITTPMVRLVTELTDSDIGLLLKIEDLTVVSIYESTLNDAFTITAEDSLGNVITIRRDGATSTDITINSFIVGTTFDIVAPLGFYDSKYQLMIANLEDAIFE